MRNNPPLNGADLDSDDLLTRVSALFQSDAIIDEVNWRLDVLKEISSQPEFAEAAAGVKARLTQIFTKGGTEEEVLGRLKDVTEIQGRDGKPIELARFLVRSKRTLDEFAYRQILDKKIGNTEFLMVNLMAFFPESHLVLGDLSKDARSLRSKLRDLKIPTIRIKKEEDQLRESESFGEYEELKTRFLRNWLEQFTDLTAEQIEGCSPEEIQQLVIEHQRHQMTNLLKTQIMLSETNMTERLGVHDTLECDFSNEVFWEAANIAVKNGFRKWILAVIQSFGMLKGRRYAFFQSKRDSDQYLLFGVGVTDLPDAKGLPLVMVPYVKPFTRKGGYLLEIRQREINDPEQYHHELRHYVLPFLFGFDQVPNFEVSTELITFFTSSY